MTTDKRKPPPAAKHRLHHNPLDAVDQLAARSHAGYWTAAMQRSCVLAALLRGPATRAALSQSCASPSVTKRISELRRQGFAIVSGWAPIAGPGGTVSLTAIYYLAEPDTRQRDLFPEGATP
jgi:hypothetical protein